MELDGHFVKTIQTPSNTSSFTADVAVIGTLEDFKEHVLTITKLVEPVQGEVALLGLTLPPEGRSAAPFRFPCYPLSRSGKLHLWQSMAKALSASDANTVGVQVPDVYL